MRQSVIASFVSALQTWLVENVLWILKSRKSMIKPTGAQFAREGLIQWQVCVNIERKVIQRIKSIRTLQIRHNKYLNRRLQFNHGCFISNCLEKVSNYKRWSLKFQRKMLPSIRHHRQEIAYSRLCSKNSIRFLQSKHENCGKWQWISIWCLTMRKVNRILDNLVVNLQREIASFSYYGWNIENE